MPEIETPAGTPAPGEDTNKPKPTPTPTPGAPASPPPAALTVIEGKTERELALEREADELRKTVKQREIEAAEKADELHRYKKSVETAKPKKEPARRVLGMSRRED